MYIPKKQFSEGDFAFFSYASGNIKSSRTNLPAFIYLGTRYSKLRTQRHAARFGYNQEIDKKHQGKQVKEKK